MERKKQFALGDEFQLDVSRAFLGHQSSHRLSRFSVAEGGIAAGNSLLRGKK
jgi:hypothetical protein